MQDFKVYVIEGEDAPVKLKNNKLAEPAQGILTMYSSPGKTDLDPTPILAFLIYFLKE